MGDSLSLLSYLRRIAQVASVLGGSAATWAYRRLRRRPGGGPELLRASLERLSGSFVKFGGIL